MSIQEQLIEEIKQIDEDTLRNNIMPVIMQYTKGHLSGTKLQKKPFNRLDLIDCFKGKIHVPDDFNEPLEEFKEYME